MLFVFKMCIIVHMVKYHAVNFHGIKPLLYCVSNEVIKILTPYCSKTKENLTTKCSSLLALCSKYQQNALIIA